MTNSELAGTQGLLKQIIPDKQTSRIFCLIINAVFCALLYSAKEYHVLTLVVISTILILFEPISVYIGAKVAKDALFFLSIAFSTYVLLPKVICLS